MFAPKSGIGRINAGTHIQDRESGNWFILDRTLLRVFLIFNKKIGLWAFVHPDTNVAYNVAEKDIAFE